MLINHLERETDVELVFLSISMIMSFIFGALNILFSTFAIFHFIYPLNIKSFFDLVTLLYSGTMIFFAGVVARNGFYNFRLIHTFLTKVERYPVIHEPAENMPFKIDCIKAFVKFHSSYYFTFILSFMLLFFTIRYQIRGQWFESLFSTFCFGLVNLDSIFLSESKLFSYLLQQNNFNYTGRSKSC